jgi:hypothetical protein
MIIRCPERVCEGVVLPNKDEGDYPRAFFLYPDDDSPMELAIVGMNPGKPQEKPQAEKQRYINLARQNKDGWATYKQCKEVWRGFAKEIDYYLKPRGFLKKLGLSLNGILYTEVVFCEKLPNYKKIPEWTFELCSSHYLKPKIATFLSKCEHILCFGNEAFDHVTKLPESNQWKILRLYHPTPPAVRRPHCFAEYFEKDENVKRKIRDDFEKLEKRQKPYKCKVNYDGIKEV